MVEIVYNRPLTGDRITGIGAALVDLLISEPDQFLENLGKDKGGMTLVDAPEIRQILDLSRQVPEVVPGGAACNTIVGVGRLGGKARFIGCRGSDDHGRMFEDTLLQCRVEPVLFRAEMDTGMVLSVITPDAQRSMFTCLGASTGLVPDAVTPELFQDTAIAMIEGYLLFNPELMAACLKSAREAGALIALDLASFEVVAGARQSLGRIIYEYVDILIANEDEAREYTAMDRETRALEKMAHQVPLAVLKQGGRGSLIAHGGRVTDVKPITGEPVMDTTGAGDLWAAGFLYGLTHGLSLGDCGWLGSLLGYEVCRVVGAHIPDDRWPFIRDQLEKKCGA